MPVASGPLERRPILYRTSKEFLMRFGLSDLDELPSLKEFEQLARAALGADEGIAPVEPDAELQTESAPESAAQAPLGQHDPDAPEISSTETGEAVPTSHQDSLKSAGLKEDHGPENPKAESASS